jgi:HEAT repeat protein
MRSRPFVNVLLRLGIDGREDLLIWESLVALGVIGSRTATRPLLRLARASDSRIRRQAAVFALGLLNDKRGRSTLIKVLLDTKEGTKIRGLAAEALGLLPAKRGTTMVLVEMLQDPSAEVRYSALCALGALRANSALGSIESLLGDTAVVDGEMSVGDRAASVMADMHR